MEYDAVNKTIEDLRLYKTAAAQAAGKMGIAVPSNDSTGGDGVTIITSVPHVQHVATRLEFLLYVPGHDDFVPVRGCLRRSHAVVRR